MLEWIGLIPLLGLTGNWRGYRMGGKAIGGSNMPTDLKKKFEAARAAGKVDEANAMADRVQKFNDDKKAEKVKSEKPKTIAKTKTDGQKIAQAERIVDQYRKRINDVDDQISTTAISIRVVEQARREGLQLVETGRTGKSKASGGTGIPGSGGTYKVMKKKANAAQLAKIDAKINDLYRQMGDLDSNKQQLIQKAQNVSKVAGDIEFRRGRGL
jgi:hypothetical protein